MKYTPLLFASLCCSFVFASPVFADSSAIGTVKRVLCEKRFRARYPSYLQKFDHACPKGWRTVMDFQSTDDVTERFEFEKDQLARYGAKQSLAGCFTRTKSSEWSSFDVPRDTAAVLSLALTCEPESEEDSQIYTMYHFGYSLTSHVVKETFPQECEGGLPCPIPTPVPSYSNGSNQKVTAEKLQTLTSPYTGSTLVIGKQLLSEVDLEGLQELARVNAVKEAKAVLKAEVYCCPSAP